MRNLFDPVRTQDVWEYELDKVVQTTALLLVLACWLGLWAPPAWLCWVATLGYNTAGKLLWFAGHPSLPRGVWDELGDYLFDSWLGAFTFTLWAFGRAGPVVGALATFGWLLIWFSLYQSHAHE